jgi:hypothetical protein
MHPVRTKLRLSVNLHLYMQRRSPKGEDKKASIKKKKLYIYI